MVEEEDESIDGQAFELALEPARPRRSREVEAGLALRLARDADAAALRLGIVQGCDVDAVDPSTGWTPLHWAGSLGKLACVELLLAAGAGMHLLDAQGRSAARVCAQSAPDGLCLGAMIDFSQDAALSIKDFQELLGLAKQRGWADLSVRLESISQGRQPIESR